jgi:hypothetical protein
VRLDHLKKCCDRFHRSCETEHNEPGDIRMLLTDFEALTFDCYGTLIDWESGMIGELPHVDFKFQSMHEFVKTHQEHLMK